MLRSISSWAVAALATLGGVHALDTISAVGAKFFTSSGSQWYIKGIAYQLDFSDPLMDGDQCTRDAKLMATLGANVIRVYHVDPTADHDACMSAFADQGIYAFIDLDTFNTQIQGQTPTWNQTQFDAFTKVLDAFQKYDNLAGVFVGNEVLTTPEESQAAAYVKAAARDLKAYRDGKGYRKIPVGYSAADIAQLRPMLQNYLVCGGNASEAVDFFSLNAYEWCGQSSFDTSGYVNLQQQAQGYPAPIFFSETGCITVRPRLFTDQGAIFGPQMVNTWSGAIIYEWLQEANNYGLISYAPGGPAPGTTAAAAGATNIVRSGTPTPISPDFDNLKTAWESAKPTGVQLADYSASTSAISTPACPASTAGPTGWGINGNPSIPALGASFNPSATGSSAGSTATKAAAPNGAKELTGMTIGLGTVMVGFVIWL